MKREDLTARQVKHMKPGSRRIEVAAGPPKGLYLVVHPTGRKGWIFRYRFDGRTRGLTFKEGFPDLTLAAARAEAEAAAKKLEGGIDPAVTESEPEPEERQPDPVREVAAEFVERRVKGTRTWRETERILKTEVVSRWGNRPVGDIRRSDVLKILDEIVDRPAPAMANKALNVLRRFFGWALERGYVESSPCTGIRPPGREVSRDRVLTNDELVEVWLAAGEVGYPFGPFARLLILTAQRRGEAASMRWRDLDLTVGLWTLPKETVKSGRIHDVPLAPAAVELLESLPRFEKGDHVFTTTSGTKGIGGFSKAKSGLDQALLAARRKAAVERGEDPEKVQPPPRWTIHDLRRTAATHMAKANVPPHVLAAILNHSPGRTLGISAIYIRHRYLAERREALEAWAEHLLELVRRRESQEKRTVA
jgi:integrase